MLFLTKEFFPIAHTYYMLVAKSSAIAIAEWADHVLYQYRRCHVHTICNIEVTEIDYTVAQAYNA